MDYSRRKQKYLNKLKNISFNKPKQNVGILVSLHLCNFIKKIIYNMIYYQYTNVSIYYYLNIINLYNIIFII